jgi:hypothetical protein
LSHHEGEGGQGAGKCHVPSLANSPDTPMTIR